MLPNKNDYNDLEYLAQQGFEKVNVSNADLVDLRKRINVKTSSLNSFYISLASLLFGVILGGILFYVFHGSRQSIAIESTQEAEADVPKQDKVYSEEMLYLDTVQVVKDNFIKAQVPVEQIAIEKPSKSSSVSSVEIMRAKPIDPSLLTTNKIDEKQLKYIINAPVFYLHNLKITNYTTLYFRKERFVKFTGVSAAYPNKTQDAATESSLKQNSERYLHEEIEQAMLYFKNEKYNEAIQVLKTISDYNKDDLNCNFYLAMCYYHKKNLNLAISYFDKCLVNVNNTFLQEAMYYKAVSLYEKGNKEEASALFKKIEEADEFYSSKARLYLKN